MRILGSYELRSSYHISSVNARKIFNSNVHARRTHRDTTVYAYGGSPYEPLERAIEVINRVITVGENSRKSQQRNSSSTSSTDFDNNDALERWVQFGSFYQTRHSITSTDAHSNIKPSSSNLSSLLKEYLSLSPDQYALLDPKWISRDDSDPTTFQLIVPLRDVIGVDLVPQLTIHASPDAQGGKVTLIGKKAALGSPALDGKFKLHIIAELSTRQRRRLPSPQDIPYGKIVPQRFRRWATIGRPRGQRLNTTTLYAPPSTDLTTTTTRNLISADSGEAIMDNSNSSSRIHEFNDDSFDLIQDELVSSISMVDLVYDNDNKDAIDSSGDAASFEMHGEQWENVLSTGTVAAGSEDAAMMDGMAASPALSEQQERHQQTAILHCSVSVSMSVRVPRALRVVPNPLLGTAGRLIIRAILKGVVPNFATLLGNDFLKWAQGGKRENTSMEVGLYDGLSDLNTPPGDAMVGGAGSVHEGAEAPSRIAIAKNQ